MTKALAGGTPLDPTQSTDIRDAQRTGHTDPRKRHHPAVPLLGDTNGPPDPARIGWKVPAYASPDFWRWLLFAGLTQREFERTGLYGRAVATGLIVAGRWQGPAGYRGDVMLPPKGTTAPDGRRNPETPYRTPADR